MVRKQIGQEPAEIKGPDDTTRALTELLNDYHADLFMTSGHATASGILPDPPPSVK